VQVTVWAEASPIPTETALSICPSDSLVYNGETLWPGEVRQFVFQDQHGCDSLVNLTISAYPAIDFELGTAAICPGTSEGFVEVMATAGDGPFSAAVDGGSFFQSLYMEGLAAGQYTVQVQDAHGCLASQNIEIQELPPLEIATEDDVLPCEEPFLTLRPTVLSHSGSLHWNWGDGTQKDWLQVKQAGIFTVSVSDDCSTEERAISVTWSDGGPEEPFYVPNAFSPNSDGVNDVFKVYLAEGAHFDEFLLMVFDRWGDQIFVTEDPELGWNGLFRDQQMDPAVLVWYVTAKVTVCGNRQLEVFKRGDVTVMR
jgi:gliding motility-associated-like protein